jgi:hypothetical protein
VERAGGAALAAGPGRSQEVVVKLFTKGHRVSQANYGPGTVVSSDERYTVIEFDHHGRRMFITDMVTLGRTDEPAPVKPVRARGRRKKAAVEAVSESDA